MNETIAPPHEIKTAIVGWLKSLNYQWLKVRSSGDVIHLTVDPRWCDSTTKATLSFYDNGIILHRDHRSVIFIDYADPQLFDRIEWFINSLPNQ